MCKKCKLNDSIKQYTNPCPSKAIFNNLIKLNNSNNSNILQENTSEKSCYKNVVTNNIKVANDHITMKTLDMGKTQNQNKDTKEHLGVMAVIAIMEPATESQSSIAYKIPLRSRPSNKIRVLLDSMSDGDLFFLQKGKDKPFPYLTIDRCQSLGAHQMGASKQMGESRSDSTSLSILQAANTPLNLTLWNMMVII